MLLVGQREGARQGQGLHDPGMRQALHSRPVEDEVIADLQGNSTRQQPLTTVGSDWDNGINMLTFGRMHGTFAS